MIEHGTEFCSPTTHGHWLVVGPLSCEVHRWWFRLGVSAGPWYVAAYLGFFVVAIGKRRWLETRPKQSWTVSSWSSAAVPESSEGREADRREFREHRGL